jgi:hypothetical protein
MQGDYKVDVFTGAREKVTEQNMAIHYARHGLELSTMSDQEMAAKFNSELSRAARCFPVPRDAAQVFVTMHRRHGETVARVLGRAVAEAGGALFVGTLDPTSMLALIAGQRHVQSSWTAYAERIVRILSDGLPPICTKSRPLNEPALQAICDGLLKGHELNLRREYPFLAWGWSTTKPDWSSEQLQLWVELKYVRQKAICRPSHGPSRRISRSMGTTGVGSSSWCTTPSISFPTTLNSVRPFRRNPRCS